MATLKNSPKINLRTILFVVVIALIVSNSCALAHTDVTAEQARDLIDSTNDLIVVDVREPYEYCDDVGHIPGALNYPLSSGVLEARYEELPTDGPILVVCRSGGRSNVAANFLDSKDFSMVYDMMGGMSAWEWETEPCKDDSESETTDSAETNTYVFLPDQSTVAQTGGIAGVHWIYSIEGLFQLTVDPNEGTALFAHVDANATDDSPLRRTLDPNEVFNMASLAGAVLDDTTISFTGKADDGSDVLVTVTIEDNLAYLVGETIPPPNTADFFLFSLDAVAQRKYDGGSGEPNNPYQIATADDLILLGDSPADYDKHFILIADIDLDPNMPGRKVFGKAVIAAKADTGKYVFQESFTGVFDGNGHTISHLTITGENHLGLFGQLGWFGQQLGSGAEVKNLGVLEVNITGSSHSIGGLAGASAGAITGCYSTGTVRGTEYVGGLAGGNLGGDLGIGRITASHSTAMVTGYGHVGGLVGDNQYGNIFTSYSTGTVSGDRVIGGLVGDNGGNIFASYSTGTVFGSSDVGGLVGWNDRGNITSSFWDTETSGQTASAGGVGLTTAAMQTDSTFLEAGWDFVDESVNGIEDIWSICEGTNYPRLASQIPAGDFVCPDGTAIEDFVFFIEHWGDENCDTSNDYCHGTDLDFSGTVDADDFEILLDDWLQSQMVPPQPAQPPELPLPPPPPKGRGCFPADTPVWVNGALVQISNAISGQMVGKLNCGLATGGLEQIETVEEHEGTFECRDIVLESGNRISVVDAHCFMLDSKQWIAAQDLRSGLRLKTFSGTVGIKSVATSTVPFVGKVYNLKIKGASQYFVGKDRVIVRDY